VDTVFSGRFDRERGAIERLAQHLEPEEIIRLWIAGELVSLLRWQLRQSVGLCHHAAEFAGVTSKLLKAAEYWFAALEESVGPLRCDDVPAQVRQELTSIGIETASNWSELPVSLVTSL
jgi:hypothetical protein